MSAWTGVDAVGVARQVGRLHTLGPRPLLEFLAELAADPITRVDIEANLARYCRLTPAMIDSVGARELILPIFVVDDTVSSENMRGAA